MEATRYYHPKRSRFETEKQILYDITDIWNLKYSTNGPIHETESRTSLVAQMVKNLPAMQETWVQSLGWEYLLERK